MATFVATEYVRWFDQVGIGDVGLVGGKNASLGEMYQQLTPQGVKIPNGFATTAALATPRLSVASWDCRPSSARSMPQKSCTTDKR